MLPSSAVLILRTTERLGNIVGIVVNRLSVSAMRSSMCCSDLCWGRNMVCKQADKGTHIVHLCPAECRCHGVNGLTPNHLDPVR